MRVAAALMAVASLALFLWKRHRARSRGGAPIPSLAFGLVPLAILFGTVVGVTLLVVGVVFEMSPLLTALVSGRLRWSTLATVASVNVAGYAVGGCAALLVISQSRLRSA